MLDYLTLDDARLRRLFAFTERETSLVWFHSVTRLGDFWKFLATNILTKVAQIFGNFLGCCEKHYFVSKNCCGSFLGRVWKNWATFYSNIWSHCVWTTFFLNVNNFLQGTYLHTYLYALTFIASDRKWQK